MRIGFGLIVVSLLMGTAAAAERPRLLVLTDIGGDPDDMQSLRRLMLYANELEIVGLIASASGTPGEIGRAVTRPDLIEDIIDDYALVRERLAGHADGYPEAERLRTVIRAGSSQRGVEHLGEGRATEGSEFVIAVVDASDRPLYVAIWGGAHDLAQALRDVRERRSAAELAAFVAKLRVYAIGDQDAWRGRPGTVAWIRDHFPNMRLLESGFGIDKFTALFRGMYQNDSRGGGQPTAPLVRDPAAALNQEAWVRENARSGHGALGDRYPIVPQNPGSERNTRGVKEGDTPSWFFVLPIGLSDPEHPEHGGWGGRFERVEGESFQDAEDAHWSGTEDSAVRRKWTVARWRDAYQHDFAARLDWCVAERYEDANHPPSPVLNGDDSREIVRRRAAPGSRLRLSAADSRDPDEDALAFRWFLYREAGGYDGDVAIETARGPEAVVEIPTDAAGRTIHVVLAVTDSGTPPLTRYRRVVIEPIEGAR